MKSKELFISLILSGFLLVVFLFQGCCSKDKDPYEIIKSKLKNVSNYSYDFKTFENDKLTATGKYIVMDNLQKIDGKNFKEDKVYNTIYLDDTKYESLYDKDMNSVVRVKLSGEKFGVIEHSKDLKYIGEGEVEGVKTFIFEGKVNPDFNNPFCKMGEKIKINYDRENGMVIKMESGEFTTIHYNVVINDKDINESTFLLPINENTRIIEMPEQFQPNLKNREK